MTEAKQNVFPSLLERISYFSDWNRARKAIAGCFRFIDILHSRSAKGSPKVNSMELTVLVAIYITNLIQWMKYRQLKRQ